MSKYCAKCHKVANDGDAFCGNCASSEFVENIQTETSPQPENSTIASANGQSQPNNVQPSGGNGNSFGNIAKKVAFIGLPIILVVAIVLANLSPITGFITKTFSSPEKYLEHSVTNSVSNAINDASETYDKTFINPEYKATDATLSFNISKDFSKLTESYIGEGIDFNWLNTTKFNIYSNHDDNRTEYKAGIVLDNENVLSPYIMVDSETGMFYIKIEELTERVLGFSFNKVFGEEELQVGPLESREMLSNIMPDSKTLDKLTKKYLSVAFAGINNVEKSSEKIEIAGVSQKLTVLTFIGNEEQLYNMLIPIFEKAKEDKDIKKIIENAQKTIEEYAVAEDEEVDENLYDMFVESIDELLKQAYDYKDENGLDKKEWFRIKVYVSGLGDVSGMEVIVDKKTEFSCIKVEDGNKFATEFSCPALVEEISGEVNAAISLKGNGTNKGGKVNASYEIIVEDKPCLIIDVKNYDKEQAKKGYFNGTFRIAPTEELYDISDAQELGLLDPYFEISFKNTSKTSNSKITVGLKDEELISILVDVKYSKTKKIEPMTADYDADSVMQWASTLDTSKVVDKILNSEFGKFVQKMIEISSESNDIYQDDADYDYGYSDDYEDSLYGF